MKLFKDIKKGAAEASEKAKLMIEINKFKIQISQNQKEIDEEFRKIGETVFELFKEGNTEELPEGIIESCNACLSKQEKNKELELEIRKLKNEKNCPKCGNTVKLDVKYCPSCGNKLEVIEEENNLESQEKPSEITVKCNKCQTENEENAKFCCNCGESIDK
ncbi:zinc ribbon domain-containing protein [Maledivibacter halophilus]|uniref:Double zinc ribbon n=1 Tax=Maledivibacter halophilus TaxID=36842 RepID=A0A1T5M409_9FIRM|nr:zinc ribbon domain-containing protein [Maledivibacter halophilus]SKC82987.1 Double zinc ribbon [Maledivibacter halophilus]